MHQAPRNRITAEAGRTGPHLHLVGGTNVPPTLSLFSPAKATRTAKLSASRGLEQGELVEFTNADGIQTLGRIKTIAFGSHVDVETIDERTTAGLKMTDVMQMDTQSEILAERTWATAQAKRR